MKKILFLTLSALLAGPSFAGLNILATTADLGAVAREVVGAQANVTLFASENDNSSTQTELPMPLSQPAPPSLRLDAALLAATPRFDFEPASATALAAGQVYRGRRSRMTRSGSVAALMLGAAATIAGSAILVYANRPECSANQSAGGCGYGTKVIGGSVLAGGVVGLFVGALTWQ